MQGIIVFTLFVILLLPISSTAAETFEIDKIQQFENWAQQNDISIVGVNKNAYDLYYTGYYPETDKVDWKEIPGVLIAADALYKIPKNVIQVMNGKTIYFSTEHGRSYTVLNSFPDYNILVGLDRGIILEQNINPHTVIHEIGHIVDYHGIQGIYNDEQQIFEKTLNEKIHIFNVTKNQQDSSSTGYVSSYAITNDAENFAENFAYYVYFPKEFREKLKSDFSLIDEYEFMRDEIFEGYEFN